MKKKRLTAEQILGCVTCNAIFRDDCLNEQCSEPRRMHGPRLSGGARTTTSPVRTCGYMTQREFAVRCRDSA